MQSHRIINPAPSSWRRVLPLNALIRSRAGNSPNGITLERQSILLKSLNQDCSRLDYAICKKSRRLMEYANCKNINAHLSGLNHQLHVKAATIWFICSRPQIQHIWYWFNLRMPQLHKALNPLFLRLISSIWKGWLSQTPIKSNKRQSAHHHFRLSWHRYWYQFLSAQSINCSPRYIKSNYQWFGWVNQWLKE